VEVGSEVTKFKAGDRVTGLGGGGYREYIVMEEIKTCHIPDNLSDEDAIVEPLAYDRLSGYSIASKLNMRELMLIHCRRPKTNHYTFQRMALRWLC
jgi:NADPH:quinone reductase-like Zn-dependent oxidoreductase